MRMRVYHFLVNRHAGIRGRYHRIHDRAHGVRKVLSWMYLLLLNFCYYVLFCRFLDKPEQMKMYEEKHIPVDKSESEAACGQIPGVGGIAEQLAQYDVVSFDIFDTLIFRPFSEPADVFCFVGMELGILDFKRIRMEQEYKARQECFREKGHYEVSFSDIWNRIEREVGIPAEAGMQAEQELERKFCYANPFMRQVFQKLREEDKKIIAISDMYLSENFLWRLLWENGYTGIDKLYISCEYEKNKGTGGLFDLVRKEQGSSCRIIHVGDNMESDVLMAKKHGFNALHYPNVNQSVLEFRPYDMSAIIGGAYRGLVSNHLYQGLRAYSMEYEYGFVYGGLFVTGYCAFIHRYCMDNGIDRILFLSRDGDILKQAYDRLYPGEDTAYVYWSRSAAVKLMAEHNRYDFFRRYLYHKVNQGISVRRILTSMGLPSPDILRYGLSRHGIGVDRPKAPSPEEELTDRNVEPLKEFLLEHFQEIVEIYREQDEAAKAYFEKVLAGAHRVAAVDIGWAGSGAASLSYLAERVWKLPCGIMGIVAGTNTLHNAEPDASEAFLQSGKMAAYLYSQGHNRDLLKKHDPNKDYNVFWELLLSSPTPQFLAFNKGRMPGDSVYLEDLDISLCFGSIDANQEGIREIQRGILDFVGEYQEHFKAFPYMFQISGRDAYAPMLAAAGRKEKYLREIEKRFALEINVS